MGDEQPTSKPARRPTGRETSAIRQKEIDAEARVKEAEIADRDKARNDEIAKWRVIFEGIEKLVRAALPTRWTLALLVLALLGSIALVYNRQFAWDFVGLGKVTTGGAAEFDPHAMIEDTDAPGAVGFPEGQ